MIHLLKLCLFISIFIQDATANIPAKKKFITTMITGFNYSNGHKLYKNGLEILAKRNSIPFKFFHYTHKEHLQIMYSSLDHFNCSNGIESLQSKSTGFIIYVTSWGANKGRWLANEFQKRCGRRVDLFVFLDGVNKPSIRPATIPPISNYCVNFYQTRSQIHGAAINHCKNLNLSKLCDESLNGGRGLFNCHQKLHILKSAKLEVYNILESFILDHSQRLIPFTLDE